MLKAQPDLGMAYACESVPRPGLFVSVSPLLIGGLPAWLGGIEDQGVQISEVLLSLCLGKCWTDRGSEKGKIQTQVCQAPQELL